MPRPPFADEALGTVVLPLRPLLAGERLCRIQGMIRNRRLLERSLSILRIFADFRITSLPMLSVRRGPEGAEPEPPTRTEERVRPGPDACGRPADLQPAMKERDTATHRKQGMSWFRRESAERFQKSSARYLESLQ